MTTKKFFARVALVAVICLFMVAGGAGAKEATKSFPEILKSPALSGAVTALLVRDLKTGKMLYSQNGGEIMIPASNMKVITAGGAILALGPDYRFHTDFFVKNFNKAAGLSTGLYVKGYGDPTLGEDFFGTASNGIDKIAAYLKSAGIKKLEGVLWLDDSFFANVERPATWEKEDTQWCYAPRPGALSAGGNCLLVNVRGANQSGHQASLVLDPALDGSMLSVNVKTVSKGSAKVSISQDETTGKIIISGTMLVKKSAAYEYTVPKPAFMYGSALIAALKRAGIETKLEIRQRTDVPQGYVFFERYESIPLAEVLGEMCRESDNFVAEQMVRVVGALRGGGGTHEKGLAAITAILKKYKVADDGNLVMKDGSGLSRENRLRPEVLLSLLYAFYNSELKDALIGALARPGEQGTLKKRVPEARGRLWGKTGAIKGVCSLSGYYLRNNGDMAAFVMVMNGYTVHSGEIRKIQDELVKVMLEM